MEKTEKIGRNQYAALLRKKTLTDEEKKQIEAYQKPTEESSEKLTAYAKKVYSSPSSKPQKVKMTKKEIWPMFQRAFKHVSGNEWVVNEETTRNIAPIINYFTEDESFFSCEALRTDLSEPSFDKGLLVIGGYGIGKTDIFLTLHRVFQHLYGLSFRHQYSQKLVEEFESCETPEQRRSFWDNYSLGRLYLDDVKAEREASNYGKVNIIRELLEMRYTRSGKTFMTCNFKPGHNGQVEPALEEFSERYGGRVHDRLFEMCNIIQFTGKSFRR